MLEISFHSLKEFSFFTGHLRLVPLAQPLHRVLVDLEGPEAEQKKHCYSFISGNEKKCEISH